MADRRFPLCALMMMMVRVEYLGSRSLRRGDRMGMEMGSRRGVAKVLEVKGVAGGLRGGLFEQKSRIG